MPCQIWDIAKVIKLGGIYILQVYLWQQPSWELWETAELEKPD